MSVQRADKSADRSAGRSMESARIESLESLIAKAAQLTLFIDMLGMGLNVTLRQLTLLPQHRGLLIRTLLASFVLVPIVAFLVLAILPLSAPVKVGIGLMAISPGASITYRRVNQMGWDGSLAASYQVIVSLLAVVFVPLAVLIIDRLFVDQGAVDSQQIFKQVLAAQLIPLAIGLAIRAGIPDFANDVDDFVRKIGGSMFLALAIFVLIKGLEDLLHAGFLPVLAMILISAASLAIGHILGGSDPTTRATLAIANTMRNAGLALVITALNFTRSQILPTIVVYALVAAIAVTIYHHRYKAMAKAEEAPSVEQI